MTILEKTAAKVALIDDYGRQCTSRGIVTCLGGDKKQILINEMVVDGLLVLRHPELNYGVIYHNVTNAGWKWLAEKRCFQ